MDVFFAHDIQSNCYCCGSVSWWHCNHHSLSGEWHASYPAIRRIVGLLFDKTGDQHLFSWGAFWGLQNLECLVWCIAQFHKLQILAVTTWIPEPDYWTNYPYRCNVPYVLVLSVDPRLLCLVQEDWWMVRRSISNGGFTWWRHGLRPCEQLPGTRVPGFWLVQRKVFQSPFGSLSWHV